MPSASDGVTARVSRVAGARTGRIGVIVAPGGERCFVADRGAADLLERGRPPGAWFERRGRAPPAGLLAARRAARSGRPAGDRARARGERRDQRRPRVDRAPAGRRPTGGARPGRGGRAGPAVRDRGRSRGARSADAPSTDCSTSPRSWSSSGVRRAPRSSPASATSGSASRSPRAPDGDRHDRRGRRVRCRLPRRLVRVAGVPGDRVPASLQRAAVAGHRAAARQLSTPRAELPLL